MFDKKTGYTAFQIPSTRQMVEMEREQAEMATRSKTIGTKKQKTTEEFIQEVYNHLEHLKLHLVSQPEPLVLPIEKTDIIQVTYESYLKAYTLSTLIHFINNHPSPLLYDVYEGQIVRYLANVVVREIAHQLRTKALQDPYILLLACTSSTKFKDKTHKFDDKTRYMYGDIIANIVDELIKDFHNFRLGKKKDLELQYKQVQSYFTKQMKIIDISRYDSVLCDAMATFITDYINEHYHEIIHEAYRLVEEYIKYTLHDEVKLQNYEPNEQAKNRLYQLAKSVIRKKIMLAKQASKK